MALRAQRNTDVFRAVADPIRRAILDTLKDGAKPVHQLAAEFPVSRPAISKHLRILRNSRLVSEQRKGRLRMYELDASPLSEVAQWVQEYRTFWKRNLRNLKAHIETQQQQMDTKRRTR